MKKGRYPKFLLLVYVIFWIILAIKPLDRGVWSLENILVVLFILTLIFTYKKFRFSNASYTLIFTFMVLHTIGAHYTYAQVPLGFWLKDTFDLTRNHFDRLIHFSFGLLMAYPVREIFLKLTSTKGKWTYYLPFGLTLAFSSIFEILEWAIVVAADPNAGINYLGMQGDIWDAQKDMIFVMFGALITLGITGIFNKRFKKN